jgi:hypothetical protein
MGKKAGDIVEKKRSRRVAVQFEAKLFSCGKGYDGVVANLSSCGIGVYVKTKAVEMKMPCMPGTKLDLEFKTPAGQTFNLHCRVNWLHVYTIPPHDLLNSMGVEIIDSPSEYQDFFGKLL